MCKAKCYQTRPSLCVFYVILLYHITHTTAEKCRKLSACSCECDGNIIDLKDLSNKAGEDPRFRNYGATNNCDQHMYSYNPCEPFTQSAPGLLQDDCHNVTGCKIDTFGGLQFFDLGTQDSVEFLTGSHKGDDVIIARYMSVDKARRTDVILQCQRDGTSFEAYGEDPVAQGQYRFILRSPSCCVSGVLSVGLMLIIIIVGLVVVYVMFGVVYNAIRYKAKGTALVNHVTVLKTCPSLIKDGATYVFWRCRRLPQKKYESCEELN